MEIPAKPRGIAPHFLVEDVRRAAEYYRDKLGFEVGEYLLDPPVFVIVQRDGIAIQLALMEDARGGSNRKWKSEAFDAHVWVERADTIFSEFEAKHADLVAPPRVTSYGMKEFEVRDSDGFVLRFGEDVPRI